METLSQSPTDPEFVQDPYRWYDQARNRGGTVFWQDYDMPVAFDAATVSALLRDRRLGRALPAGVLQDRPAHLADFHAVDDLSMLELEPPTHTRLRGLVLRAFTSRRIAKLGPEIAQTADTLLAGLPKGTAFDLIAHYCTLLPVRIIARLLGVPETMAPDLLRWSAAMVAMYQAGRTKTTEVQANQAATEFRDFLRGYVDTRRTSPRDDLISHLIAAEQDGEKLSPDELISTCILLLNAGHEATVHSIGNAVKTLLEHQTDLSVLAPDQIAATTEELLRFVPPLHMFTRYAYEDIAFGPHTLAAGQQIGLNLAAANRDPAVFADPHRLDPARQQGPHLAFGGGLHFCVGAPLARLELQIALPALFRACPDLALTEPARFANSYHFHKLDRLLVRTAR